MEIDLGPKMSYFTAIMLIFSGVGLIDELLLT